MTHSNRVYYYLAAFIGGLILSWAALDFGQAVQVGHIETRGDIAAWQNSVYLIQGETLKKLNSQLEVVETVRLPQMPPMISAEPNDSSNGKESSNDQTDMLSQRNIYPSISVDQQYVYVFHGGSIIVFGHNLAHVKTKILD